MEQAAAEVLPIKEGLVLDILDQQHPALSSSNDMPVIETKPDATPEKVAEAAPEEAEQSEESATPATEEQPGADPEVKKPPKGVQKRLDELTKQREQERARAEAAERRLDEALKKIGQPEEPKVVQEEEPARPQRADFTDDNAYFDAITEYADKRADFVAKREIKRQQDEFQKSQTEAAIAEGQRIARESYLERVAKTTEKYADFKEVAERPDVTVSIPMAHAIVHHAQGPDIQYYLGTHAEEAARISKLDVPSQLVELGIIVATKLGTAPVPAPAEKPKPVISAAPKPLTPTKAAEGTPEKPLEELDMDSYVAKRKAQMKQAEARH